MNSIASKKTFELNFNAQTSFEHGSKAAELALNLGRTAMYFANIERIPRFADGRRENDAEHSYMLALVAPEIAKALELNLDTGLIVQFAIVHDLIELKTGDIPTYLFDEADQNAKELSEHAVLEELKKEIPPHTAAMLELYEQQTTAEAHFVRYVDKLLPIVIDVVGAGRKVMTEDYGVETMEQLKQCNDELHMRITSKFGNEFPALDLAHKLLLELFEDRFELQ